MNIRIDNNLTVRLDPMDVELLKKEGCVVREFAIQSFSILNVRVEKGGCSQAVYSDHRKAIEVQVSNNDLRKLEDPEYMKNGLEFNGVCIQFDIRRAK